MKEIKTYADQYGKYYEVKDYNGLYKKFGNYEDVKNWYTYASKYYMSIDPFEESEEDKIARLAREKAEERDKKIDLILNNK
jgi:hypothetical protein